MPTSAGEWDGVRMVLSSAVFGGPKLRRCAYFNMWFHKCPWYTDIQLKNGGVFIAQTRKQST